MASALTVIVLGHAFFNSSPDTSQPQLNYTEAPRIPEISVLIQSLIKPTAEPTTPTLDREIRRRDYTYTPGIGAHKVHTTAVSWNTAWGICHDEGAHLTIINSLAESQLISRLLQKAAPGQEDAHIGFHDLFQKKKWVTLDGQSLEEAGFDKWNTGEPNDAGKAERCGCVHKNGLLNDDDCNTKYHVFVCELPNGGR